MFLTRQFIAPPDKVEVEPCLVVAALIGRAEARWVVRNGECSLRNAQTSAHSPGTAPGPHNGGKPGGKGKSQSTKASSMVLRMLALVARRQAAPLKSPATRSTFSSNITARMVNSNFLPMPRFLASISLTWRDITVNDFWPLGGCRRKEARDSTPCMTQPDSPSNICQANHSSYREGRWM